MTMTKLPMKRGILLLITAGLLALLLYMYYIVGFGNVVSQFEKINLYYYAAAFLAVLAGITFFSLTWRSLLANLSIKIKIRQALLFVYAGMFVDSIVPEPSDIAGDLMKAYLVSKVTGESSGKTTASVIGHKTLGIIITTGSLLAGLVLLVFNYYLNAEILIFVLVVLVMLACSLLILYYISTRPKASRRLVYGLIGVICFVLRGRWDSAKLYARADELLDSFHGGVQTLTASPKALVRPVLLAILSWVFDVLTVFLVFISIGYSITPDKVLIVYSLVGALQSMGISFIGVTEVVISTLYTVLSVPLPVSLTATLLLRFITFWFRLLIAYGAFQYVSLRLLFNKGEIKT
jgi:uncharacterized protein (TIRG00374 family)